jgi:hypothetical protein
MSKIIKGMANRKASSAQRAETIRVAVLNREISTGLGGYVVSPFLLVVRSVLLERLTQGLNPVEFALVARQLRNVPIGLRPLEELIQG